MPYFGVPEKYRRTITDLYGREGEQWLAELPDTIARYEDRWQLRLAEPYPLTYNYVAPATTPAGKGVVVKLPPESNPELPHEAAALALEDRGRGFSRSRARYGGTSGPIAGQHLAAAEGLLESLSARPAAPVVLHGDLHHDNILSSSGDWTAIDPKGVVGDPAYEPSTYLRNAMTPTDTAVHHHRRVARFSELLSLNAGRVAAWAYVGAVLSQVWSVEGSGDVDPNTSRCIDTFQVPS